MRRENLALDTTMRILAEALVHAESDDLSKRRPSVGRMFPRSPGAS